MWEFVTDDNWAFNSGDEDVCELFVVRDSRGVCETVYRGI